MKNKLYYALYPLILPFILLEWLIFHEWENRIWDDSLWLHRLLIWHDNKYEHYEEINAEDYL